MSRPPPAHIHTLSLHDALPICFDYPLRPDAEREAEHPDAPAEEKLLCPARSEEHTSELQSQSNLVCRLLLEKKKLNGFTTRESLIRLFNQRTRLNFCRRLTTA